VKEFYRITGFMLHLEVINPPFGAHSKGAIALECPKSPK